MTKKILLALGIGMIAMLCLVSCENEGGNASSMQFKRMDIAGAKAIALASDGGSKSNAPKHARLDGEGDPSFNVSNPVWTVSEDGTLVEVHYTIEVVGNGEIVDLVKANMRLVMQYIYPINDDWLWLVNCEYDYPGLDDIPEPLHGKIRELMNNAGIDLNFLVRKSDGALFQWTQEQGCPKQGRGYRRPSDIYGQVESLGGDVFSCPSMGGLDDYYGRIYKLDDQGDKLDVVQVLSSSQAGNGLFVDDRGFVGTMLIAGGEVPVILDPVSLKLSNINMGDIQMEKAEFVAIGGRAYIYGTRYFEETQTDGKGGSWVDYRNMAYVYELEDQGGRWTAKTPALLEVDLEKQAFDPKRVYKTEVATWMGQETDNNWKTYSYAYTFDPRVPSLTKKQLPAHYPAESDKYYEGVAYIMGDNQDFFYVCDLAKDAAEQVDINYDGLAPYMDQIVAASYMPFGPYDPNTQSFTASIQLLDGTYLTLILYTQGENRGKVTVLHEGESDAGQVISVMVRLN